MSGHAALVLEPPISLFNPALLLYAFLALVSVIVAIKTKVSKHSALRSQVFSWWIITPILTAALIIYPIGLTLLTLLICGLAAKELDTHLQNHRWRFRIFCVLILALTLAQNAISYPLYLLIFSILFVAQTFAYLMRPTAGNLIALLFSLTCFSMGSLIQFSSLPQQAGNGRFWLVYLLTITAFNDVAQYTFGKLFGRQKIAKRISPNKTWQGLFGGIAVSIAISLALGGYLRLATHLHLVVLGLGLAIAGFAGDILLSAAKRFLGIKDFSNLIPGHGGILDRVDSLIVTAPLLYFVLLANLIGSNQ